MDKTEHQGGNESLTYTAPKQPKKKGTVSGLQIRMHKWFFSYFSTKTYVVGTQKNHLNETVLLSTQNMFKFIGKKIIPVLCSKNLLNWTCEYAYKPSTYKELSS